MNIHHQSPLLRILSLLSSASIVGWHVPKIWTQPEQHSHEHPSPVASSENTHSLCTISSWWSCYQSGADQERGEGGQLLFLGITDLKKETDVRRLKKRTRKKKSVPKMATMGCMVDSSLSIICEFLRLLIHVQSTTLHDHFLFIIQTMQSGTHALRWVTSRVHRFHELSLCYKKWRVKQKALTSMH